MDKFGIGSCCLGCDEYYVVDVCEVGEKWVWVSRKGYVDMGSGVVEDQVVLDNMVCRSCREVDGDNWYGEGRCEGCGFVALLCKDNVGRAVCWDCGCCNY